MLDKLENLNRRFNALSLREQRLVAGTVIALVWAAWDSLLHQPQVQEKQRLEQDISRIQQLASSQLALSNALANSANQDPNKQNRELLASLQQSVEQMKRQLASGEKRLVPSLQMADALRDMLKQQANVKLINLETLAPKPFGSDTERPWIYRHTLSLTLQGDFFGTLNYLKALESLPWHIQWDSIDYTVKNYPLAETTIQVYTLSFEQDWLGV
jgi:MSHA biogenesis protein MshJ